MTLREPDAGPEQAPLDWVRHYHERTKHGFHLYAASLGYLDWATQPDPFRTWSESSLHRLSMPGAPSTGYDAVFQPAAVPTRPLDADALAEFLFHSFALSAWKQAGDSRWALRVNPSSGNLHPTEIYLLCPPASGLPDGPALHHYRPRDHALELRARWPGSPWEALLPGMPAHSFLLGVASIPWREAWKYGERAWRYCQHDAGHALAAARLAAASLGWSLTLLDGVADATAARWLGLDRTGELVSGEEEEADFVAAVVPGAPPSPLPGLPGELPALTEWHGKANRLSAQHHDWPVIGRVARACRHAGGAESWRPLPAPVAAPSRPLRPCSFGALVRQRRSATGYDGATAMAARDFYAMLARLLPSLCAVPWDALPWPPSVHLGLFVHRVTGLTPGLYALARRPDALPALRSAFAPGFTWSSPPDCPRDLPLFLLRAGDARDVAGCLSCHQDIASDGCFSLGMLAEFEPMLRRYGASFYRRLFWECGMIGQVLYLEAEAAGLRGTGIGCFFDDPVHELFGLSGLDIQSLYHFTVGGPVEDRRLTTLPAYPSP